MPTRWRVAASDDDDGGGSGGGSRPPPEEQSRGSGDDAEVVDRVSCAKGSTGQRGMCSTRSCWLDAKCVGTAPKDVARNKDP